MRMAWELVTGELVHAGTLNTAGRVHRARRYHHVLRSRRVQHHAWCSGTVVVWRQGEST